MTVELAASTGRKGKSMTKLAPQEKVITDWLAAQKEAMLALLGEVVNLDSGSYDKAGVDAVGARFIRFFREQEMPTTVEPPRARSRAGMSGATS